MARAQIDHYDAQRKHLEHALASKRGLKLKFDSINDARSFRMRCYHLRKLDRFNNREVYPPGDPLHNKSTYDQLVISISIDKDCAYVYLVSAQPEPNEVSEL